VRKLTDIFEKVGQGIIPRMLLLVHGKAGVCLLKIIHDHTCLLFVLLVLRKEMIKKKRERVRTQPFHFHRLEKLLWSMKFVGHYLTEMATFAMESASSSIWCLLILY
jgi:hypothetical protein